MMMDLDNTIGDRSGAVHAWLAEFCAEWELPNGAYEWILEADNDGYSAREQVFASIREQFGLSEPADELVEAYRQRVVELSRPTPGALECLADLRSAGWKIAIVTNGSSRQQHAKIEIMGLEPLVDAVVVSGDLDIKKPDRRIFDAAAAATGESFDGGWMVGDAALHDVVGAQVLGVNTAWLHRGRAWPAEYEPPTATLDDLTQLMPLLDSLSGTPGV